MSDIHTNELAFMQSALTGLSRISLKFIQHALWLSYDDLSSLHAGYIFQLINYHLGFILNKFSIVVKKWDRLYTHSLECFFASADVLSQPVEEIFTSELKRLQIGRVRELRGYTELV